MLFKLLAYTLGLYVSSAFCATWAGNTPIVTDQEINKQINYLQMQINELHNELHAEQKTQKKQKKNCFSKINYYRVGECNSEKYQRYCASLLGMGSIKPYLNKDTAFDESKLIINIPTVREDSQLLLQQHQLIQEYHRLGIPIPNLPRVTLTGKLEGHAFYGSTYLDSQSRNINFGGSAELGTYLQGNSWVSGYMALDYASDAHKDSSQLFINRAFIIIGNLSQFPLYASIGQVYVPFGCYSSLMVTTPVTQALGRTRARTLTFGYQQTGNNMLHAEVYGFQELSNNLFHSNQNNEWGADIGYKFNNSGRVNGEIGAGYISSLSNSQWIQGMEFLNTENLRHRVPALNIYGALAIDPIMLFTEYVGVMKSFNVNSIGFANQEAPCPTAFDSEASYTFKTGSKSSSIGVSYGHTSQALALGLPQDRYSIFYNINIWRETNLALEYRHDVHCAANTISKGSNSVPTTTANVVTDLSKSDNVVTAQFDLFF